jgi:hypothetical protein
MTTPALSVAIPPPKVSFSGTTTKYIIRSDGDAVPQEEELQDSDVSSICHSPGWEDSASKKRRKEKAEARERKKRERAKTETDIAKQEQKTKSRLSKAPPTTNKRLTKMSVAMDRSTSEPAVPVVQASQEVQEMKEQGKRDSGGRPRRGSIEIGIKSFIQVKNSISVPWKSSHGNPVQTSPTQSTAPPRTSTSKPTGGFIGGLKLRQAEEATIQETIRRVKATPDDDARGLLDSDRDVSKKPPGNSSSSTSIAESFRPTSIYEESIRSPEQWDSIYAQAAALARNNGVLPKEDDDNTPIMERNIRKSRKPQKSHPPTSRYFPLANDPDSSSSLRDTSAASTARTSVRSSQNSGDSQGHREPNVSSGQTTDIRDTSAEGSEMTESDRGRKGSNYINHHRQQSGDQAVTVAPDQSKGPEPMTSSETHDSSDPFQRSRSRLQGSTDSIPSTARPPTGDGIRSAADMRPTRGEKSKRPPLSHTSPTDGSLKHERKRSRSRSAVRGLIDLKNAAISAFSRHSATPSSPTESFETAAESQTSTSQRPSSSNHAATTGAMSEAPSKAEPILGEDICNSPVVHDFAAQNPLRQHPPTQAANNGVPHRQPKVKGKGNHSRGTHSRSTTGSSEDYSAYNETSNITTPTASRPQSHKDYSPSPQEPTSEGGQEDGENRVQNGFAMMSGGLLDDAAGGRESWCRTAVPMSPAELTEDEDRMKTPTAKRSAADFTAAQPESPKPSTTDPTTNSSDLRREPSLSRSISTPEMQDLSFLPALKHQPLARPPKGKGKGLAGKKVKQASVQDIKSPAELVRPPPVPLKDTATKSEGSSPTSPQSSQYLQNARLNIPRGPRSPMKSGFPTHLPLPQAGGPEPIAKMFVICCSCKYFHDMPSKVYECMAKPDNVVRDASLGVSGVISTSVKCPWCGHGMSTSCCSGYASFVFLRERLH